jgi:hypothetical protein
MPSRKGSPNKNKVFLLNRLRDMYGDDFHPIMKMAENAVEMQKLVTDDLDTSQKLAALKNTIEAWDKIAQYTEPKLKAIELGHDKASNVYHHLGDDTLKRLRIELESEL